LHAKPQFRKKTGDFLPPSCVFEIRLLNLLVQSGPDLLIQDLRIDVLVVHSALDQVTESNQEQGAQVCNEDTNTGNKNASQEHFFVLDEQQQTTQDGHNGLDDEQSLSVILDLGASVSKQIFQHNSYLFSFFEKAEFRLSLSSSISRLEISVKALQGASFEQVGEDQAGTSTNSSAWEPQMGHSKSSGSSSQVMVKTQLRQAYFFIGMTPSSPMGQM
jgi:hypothetical protein